MTILTKQDLPSLADQPGRFLGVDVGTKIVGLALSDPTGLIASPHLSMTRQGWKKDLKTIADIIEQSDVKAIVVGLPINMDGSEGPRSEYARKYGEKLAETFDVPVCFWDERLSTVAVERTLLEADLSRKRRSEVIDKLAASYILQGLLDWLRNTR